MKSILPALLLLLALFPLRAQQVVIGEIMYHPPGDFPEYLVIRNLTATPHDIAEWEMTEGVAYRFPAFSASQPSQTFLGAFGTLILTGSDPAAFRSAYGLPDSVQILGPWTGSLSNSGERLTLTDKNGVDLCSIRYNDRGQWPVAPDGTGHSLLFAKTSTALEVPSSWRASTLPLPVPGAGLAQLAEEPINDPTISLSEGLTYVDLDSRWDFNDQNIDITPSGDPSSSSFDPSNEWFGLDYDFRHPGWTRENDAANNGALYGFETNPVVSPGLNTGVLDSPQNVRHVSYYFRKEFNYLAAPNGAVLSIDGIIDDGAQFYLNGIPIGGRNIGPYAGHNSTASSGVNNAELITNYLSNSGNALRQGRNVLSAQLHQSSATSSDLLFGARLRITGQTANQLLINEILPARSGLGFIEFYNNSTSPINLQGWYLSTDPRNLQSYQIPDNLTLAPGALATVDFLGSGLVISGRTEVYLTQPDGATLNDAISASLPVDGRSAGRKPAGSGDWFLFQNPTPGEENGEGTSRGEGLRFNEFAQENANTWSWVELYNASSEALSTDSLFIATTRDFSDKQPLTGIIASGGAVAFDLSFMAEGNRTSFYLIDAGNRVLDAVSIRNARTHLAAFPNGSKDFNSRNGITKGLRNPAPPLGPIVINEIMADPPSKEREGEYLELFNRSSSSVDLSGWRFDDGIEFVFPENTTLAPGAYLILAASAAHVPNAAVFAEYEGSLSNGGERIQLVDAEGYTEDEVHYFTGGVWPSQSNAQGSSLELIHPDMDNSFATSWRASDESQKTAAQWQSFSITEDYIQRRAAGGGADYREFHLLTADDAHIAVRNLSLKREGNPNNLFQGRQLNLSTDGTGVNGWLCVGNHHQSEIRNGGELHLITTGHGDEKANHCEIDVLGINAGDTLTLEFEARWLSGCPTLLYETWDRSFGGQARLSIPENLGTPGAANSTSELSPLPTVRGLLHSPAVPTSNDSVTVTVEASGAQSVRVHHRLDTVNNSEAFTADLMKDDGQNGDLIAGDGIFTAIIDDYRSNGLLIQFYVEATNIHGTTLFPRRGQQAPAMWFTDDPLDRQDLRSERFLISARDLKASTTTGPDDGDDAAFDFAFPTLSNHYFNCTFISNEKDVFYNYQIRKRGSPFTRSKEADYSQAKWKAPSDQRFRGFAKRSIDNDLATDRRFNDRLVRYWLYLLGQPVSQQEVIQVGINGQTAFLSEEIEPINSGFLERNFKNGEKGELYRIDDEFLLTDSVQSDLRNSRIQATWEYLGDEAERYSANWNKRSRKCEYDYSSLISWIKGIGSDSLTEDDLSRLADIRDMAAVAVVRGWADDWDNFTIERGKNGYFYRRASDGQWMLLQWDSDRTFNGTSFANQASTARVEPFFGDDETAVPGFANFINKPNVRRQLNRLLGEMVDEYTVDSPRLLAWMTQEEDASEAFTFPADRFINWNTARVSKAREVMGASLSTPFAVTTGNGQTITTAEDFLTLEGTFPYHVADIRLMDRPDVSETFTSTTTWRLPDIALALGTHTLVVQAFDSQGRLVAERQVEVQKSGNGAPVIALSASPVSFNMEVTALAYLDATGTYDPEGDHLFYRWEAPAGVLILDQGMPSTRLAFTAPGSYPVTLTVTDSDGRASTATRSFSIYGENGFSSFSETELEDFWDILGAQPARGDFLAPTWSLTDRPRQLTLRSAGGAAQPFQHEGPSYPRLLRDLPENDWSIQTEVSLSSVPTGDYLAGLTLILADESFAYGLDEGGNLSLYRSTDSASSLVGSIALPEAEIALRVRRIGLDLFFEYRSDRGIWTLQETLALASISGGSTAGIFIAPGADSTFRAAFDYFLLSDPALGNSPLQDLRIVEVMYHPAENGDAEYIELQNTGDLALDLTGIRFEEGSPFSALTLSSGTLAPGERALLVKSQTAFNSTYSGTFRILGEWTTGSLSNGGEEILMRDPQGQIIQQFTYDDQDGWPEAADGQGPSLEVIDPQGDYNDPNNWRASGLTGGSPGAAPDFDGDGLDTDQEDALGTDPFHPDTDLDGVPDGLEVAVGTDPLLPDTVVVGRGIEKASPNGTFVVRFDSLPGLRYQIESSPSLESDTWTSAGVVEATGILTEATVTSNLDTAFFRVRIAP